nr:unnamed protein product [Callosobruchus chinensis]
MDKLMDIAEDPDTLVCVNPHHVNPLTAGRCAKDTMTYSSHKWGDSSPQVKLEMEEFRDLSSFVEPSRSLISTADELNTPTFDKDVFDFDIFTSSSRISSMTQEEEEAKDLPNEDLLIKLEGEALYSATNNNHHHHHQQTMLMNSNIFTMDVTSYIADATTTTITNTGSGPPSPAGSATERIEIIPMSAVAAPAAAGGGASAFHHLQQRDRVVCPKDNRSPLSVGPFKPTSSRTTTPDARQHQRPRLSLNVDLKPTQQHPGKIESNLSTPAIIDDVVGMEFNILDLVKNEDMSSISVDEIFSASPNSSANTTVSGSPASTVNTVFLADLARPKRSRKRKTFEDFEEDDQEDEDYVPPFEKSRRKVSRRCSDYESESEVRPRGRPKGRPPRRADSLSSDCSKDSDANKYRELRDKNNEASRKSRLKRKFKEQEIEKEAEELNWKNVKLKAQVEELEKMVNNFRDNLFKIMTKS